MNAKTRKTVLAVAALAAVVAVVLVCWLVFGRQKGAAGAKDIGVTVTFADQSTKDYDIQTDEEYLRGALEQEKLISGTEGDYGLFVTTVDGVTADDAKQEWWCFTKNGETVNTGVDQTPIADGDHFEITLTTGY